MNWNNIRRGLKEVIESIDGLDHAGAVEWSDSAEASAMRKLPRIDLSVKALQGFGNDETRRDVDPDTGDMTTSIYGHRRLTFSIRVESDQATGAEPLTIADRLRVRLMRDSVIEAMRNEKLALAGFAPTQVIDFKRDGRALCVAVLDVFLNAAEIDIDDTASGAFDRVVADSESLTDPDGNPNPSQIHIDVSA